MKRKKTMPSSREIKPPSDETRSNNGDKRTDIRVLGVIPIIFPFYNETKILPQTPQVPGTLAQFPQVLEKTRGNAS